MYARAQVSQAFSVLMEMKAADLPRKRRTYAPLFTAFAEVGGLDMAIKVSWDDVSDPLCGKKVSLKETSDSIFMFRKPKSGIAFRFRTDLLSIFRAELAQIVSRKRIVVFPFLLSC